MIRMIKMIKVIRMIKGSLALDRRRKVGSSLPSHQSKQVLGIRRQCSHLHLPLPLVHSPLQRWHSLHHHWSHSPTQSSGSSGAGSDTFVQIEPAFCHQQERLSFLLVELELVTRIPGLLISGAFFTFFRSASVCAAEGSSVKRLGVKPE